MTSHSPEVLRALADDIRRWGRELGFDDVRIAGVDLSEAEPRLLAWLASGRHGQMDYMAKHRSEHSAAGGEPGSLRARLAELVPGTLAVITARFNYLHAPRALPEDWRERELARLGADDAAVVSIYARGRDYHKVLRNRLQKLAERIATSIGASAGTPGKAGQADAEPPFQYRVFTDSAPVLEVELAARASLGWRGKHTLLLSREAGSMFFLGEIFVSLPLPPDEPAQGHCGNCTSCIDTCPTGAITGPYQLDARRCISYLTIEHKDAIPEDLRPLIGNRIYGCDDCQLVCPWNKYARAAAAEDFAPRNGLDRAALTELFAWEEEEFEQRMQGSAIRRIGHERWLRNIAVALGNALRKAAREGAQDSATQAPARAAAYRAALRSRAAHPSALVREHVQWALAQEATQES
ncbi:MAG: tRNA epoxyqueuosine(34) reductase QueG [Candidatus Protistobacter heckmanni]|nr:tRNA epoxyqueuosine(34) reductase QueG [Candidatus Protistobacter heckmanni]